MGWFGSGPHLTTLQDSSSNHFQTPLRGHDECVQGSQSVEQNRCTTYSQLSLLTSLS